MKVPALAVAVALLGGCANAPTISSTEPVAIVASGGSVPPRVSITTGHAARDAGAYIGMAAGIGAGVLCGPVAGACVEIGAIGVGAVGAKVGMTIDDLIGAHRLSEDDRQRLTANAEANRDKRDPHAAFAQALASRAGSRWSIAEQAPTTVSVDVRQFELNSIGDGQVQLAMSVNVSISRQQGSTAILVLQYEGTRAPLASWLDDRDGFFERAFEECYAGAASELVGKLTR